VDSSTDHPSAVNPRQRICDGYAAAVRHINDVEIPAARTKIATLEALLESLEAEGLQDSQLAPVKDALDQANENLASANGQLSAFKDEYEILDCASAGHAPDGGSQA
jgi:hypothetical protein